MEPPNDLERRKGALLDATLSPESRMQTTTAKLHGDLGRVWTEFQTVANPGISIGGKTAKNHVSEPFRNLGAFQPNRIYTPHFPL